MMRCRKIADYWDFHCECLGVYYGEIIESAVGLKSCEGIHGWVIREALTKEGAGDWGGGARGIHFVFPRKLQLDWKIKLGAYVHLFLKTLQNFLSVVFVPLEIELNSTKSENELHLCCFPPALAWLALSFPGPLKELKANYWMLIIGWCNDQIKFKEIMDYIALCGVLFQKIELREYLGICIRTRTRTKITLKPRMSKSVCFVAHAVRCVWNVPWVVRAVCWINQ